MYFGIAEGPFSGKLNVGLLNKANTEFLGGEDIIDDDGELSAGMDDYLSRLHHEDCTSMAIQVVADHIIKHYNGKLGITYRDGATYEIRVDKKTAETPSQPQPSTDSPG